MKTGVNECLLCGVSCFTMKSSSLHTKSEPHQQKLELVQDEEKVKCNELPVVFLSIIEHNSNLLPWRETGAKIEMIRLDQEGNFDYKDLEE